MTYPQMSLLNKEKKMAIHRSALGKTVDMAALAAKNERVRAVGNMSVNARGDTIDSFGKVIKPATEKVNEKYARTVGNRSAQVGSANKTAAPRQPVKPDIIKSKPVTKPVPKPEIIKEELTQEELELDEFDDIEIEEIKAQETKKK